MVASAFVLLAALSSVVSSVVALPEPVHLVSEDFASHHLQARNGDGSKQDSTYNVTFLHINDVHAHLDEYRSSGVDCPRNSTDIFNVTKVPCFGGYSRVLTKAKEERAKKNNSLFFNAGDEFQGTLFYSFYGGWKIAEAVNQLNFSAFTLGNHEFDGGDAPLAAFLSNLTFPTVSTNVVSTYKPLAEQLWPYLLFPEHDLALVAVTTTTVPGISSPGNGTQFLNYTTSLQPVVDKLLKSRKAGAIVKRVVLLTHIGYDEDIALAKSTRGIHLIVGGHSHTRLGNDSVALGQYPTIVKNLDGEEVFIVTAWRWGQQLGEINVAFAKDSGKILSYTGAPINMTEEIKLDPELQADVLEWRKPFEEFSKVIIGQTATELDQSTCQTMECTLGNAVTDSMLYARTTLGADVDFALHNAGGIRASIEGPAVSRGDVLTAFPFGNNIVDMTFTGEELWDIFEGMVSRVNSAGKIITSFFQVSEGVQIVYNPSNPVGSRLIELNVGKTTLAPIVLATSYTITTLDFISTGGDFFFPAPLIAPPPGLGSQSDIFEAWVKEFTPLDVKVGERIVVTTETAQKKPTA
ncbi:Metallo-dependent phosphatase-like protein [Mrakia frigida]|uniref:bifunctional metallophosphatase/5'-nucleotidase n=1 Tax=Mrakia frigida TaxID=29902 RepID=UPI003FCC1CC0